MDFVQEYTAEEVAAIDREFRRLKDKHYMDHAGTTLYAESQIQAVQSRLSTNLFCNPHTSPLTGDLIDRVRRRVLQFFNTDPSEYCLVFTSGATDSLRRVADGFTFCPDQDNAPDQAGAFVYLRDNHTSVLGMRAIVGTDRICPLERDDFLKLLEGSPNPESRTRRRKPSLLVFPAQNNFNAAKYPLELIDRVQRNGLRGYDGDRFFVCLDAASYVATNFLDLGRHRPEFVCLSFYKIFGYPTGLGALLVRKGYEYLLDGKRYYGGGTIKSLLSGQNLHQKHDSLVERFEDGTQSFLSIISLLDGMDTVARLIPPARGYGSMERVSQHVFNLAKHCYRELGKLKYSNGSKVIRFYMDSNFENRAYQGGIVNFNVLREDGSFVGFAEFASVAMKNEIYVRTGCFCNAGTCQRQLGLADEDVLMFFRMGKICGDDIDMIEGIPTGTVRASFGYMNGPKDVDRLVDVIQENFESKSTADNRTNGPVLRAIYIYPIRSCGAFSTAESWSLNAEGLRYDKEFTIVDSNGNELSNGKYPEMIAIVPRIDPNRGEMVLTHPSSRDLILNLKPMESVSEVWDCGDQVASWLSEVLQTPRLRLLWHPPTIKPKLLVINRNALRSADKRVENDSLNVTSLVEYFRGSLVVDFFDVSPSGMQTWKIVELGGQRFQVAGLCTRCPIMQLKQPKSLKAIADVFGRKVPLGMYLVPLDDKETHAQFLDCGATLKVVDYHMVNSKAGSVTEMVTRYDFRAVV